MQARQHIASIAAIIIFHSGGFAHAQQSLGNNPVTTTFGSDIRLNADLPYINSDRKLSADVYINFALKGMKDSLRLSISFYKYGAKGDSTLICQLAEANFSLKQGTQDNRLIFISRNEDKAWVLPVFYKILEKTGNVPAGSYKSFIEIAGAKSSIRLPADSSQFFVCTTISYEVDSSLSISSPVRKSLNSTLVLEKKGGKGSPLIREGTNSLSATATSSAKAIERSTHRLDRMLKTRGLSSQIQKAGDKEYINLYYEDWFVGRYETEGNKSMGTQVAAQKQQLSGGITSTASTELGGYRSLLSQVKDLNRQKKEDKELTGQIGVSGAWANGQPEYSTQDNNYYEFRASLETEVMDIPVSVEGYYTTQDAHRIIKSSYARVHYDAEKAKAELLKLIGGFKQQYSNTAAKGKGLEQVYGTYLANLKDSKGALLNDIKKESGISSPNGNAVNSEALKAQIKAALEAKMAATVKDTAALSRAVAGSTDSSSSGSQVAIQKAQAAKGKTEAEIAKAKVIEDSATHIYDRTVKRYRQIEALERKIEKYSSLIEQYKTTSYFDSALAYSKVAGIEHPDEATYKQLAKKAGGLLPEGKAKTFVAGLTNLDAGIFPKYVSKYTMAGQQLKGLDAGYDIGFAQIGITVGKTEYAGRDGSLDKYTTYGARALFTPFKEQKIGLIYYGYTPSKAAFSSDNDFYKNIDIALPTFKSPVHIVSATYEGTLAKNVRIESEIATSFRNGGNTILNADGSTTSRSFLSGFDADRLAYHGTAEGHIPKSPFALTGSYEHGGKDFQNSTLPVIISGTDLYKGGMKGDFFRGFLTAGVEYNHMQQSNFYSTGGNNRWGFEVATHSKQYPSVAFSYKPFATFRSNTDTLNIPQRPLIGAVWTGKASYQVKRSGGRVWRFSAVYNKSTSQSDSVSYGSNLIQLNIIYSNKVWMAMISGGQSSLQSSGLPTDTLNPAHIRTTFGTGSISYALSKGLNVTGGADIGFAAFGLSKYGLNGGLNYRMKKVPLSVRVFGRYSTYRLPGYSGVTRSDASTDAALNSNSSGANNPTPSEPMAWQKLVSGGIDLSWQLKMKLNR